MEGVFGGKRWLREKYFKESRIFIYVYSMALIEVPRKNNTN